MRELTGGGVDHAIEVVGIAATMEQAFRMLDTKGTATVVGVAHPEVQVSIRATDLLLEKRLQGSKMALPAPGSTSPSTASSTWTAASNSTNSSPPGCPSARSTAPWPPSTTRSAHARSSPSDRCRRPGFSSHTSSSSQYGWPPRGEAPTVLARRAHRTPLSALEAPGNVPEI